MAKAHSKPEVESLEYRPAKGGAISETRTKYSRGGQGGGPDYDYEHERTIHPTLEHAKSHLAKTLAGCYGESTAKDGKETEPKVAEGKDGED